MKISEIKVAYAELHNHIMPILRGRVFHVTCRSYVPAILKTGEISVNSDGKLSTAFGSADLSYFRLKGRVSLFDYRQHVTEEELNDSLIKCSPFQAGYHCNYELAIFFLTSRAYDRLESWRLWKPTEAYGQMVVPYVEAGHPGPISLPDIDELLQIWIHHEPGPHELAFRARARA